MIQVNNIFKSIKNKEILNNINLNVNQGDILAILGPNGAGKTTLIRCILGLLKIDSGRISINDADTNSSSFNHVKSKIAVVSDGSVYNNLTVKENIRLWKDIYQVDEGQFNQELEYLVNLFEINQYLDKKVSTLSKGTKQKVLLIRSFCVLPEIIILDEPTTGLDPIAIEMFNNYIKKINNERNTTVIFCTHILKGLDDLATSIVVIDSGSVIESGTINQLKDKYFAKLTYLLEVSDVSLAQTVLNNYEVSHTTTTNKLQLVSSKEDIPEVINKLINSGINIYEIKRINDTINDLYLTILNRGGKYDF